MSEPVAITPGQLLLLDCNAYVNLITMFPLPENVKRVEDIPAFELPADYKLLMLGPKEFALICRNPPGLFAYVPWNHCWERVQTVQSRQGKS